MKKTLVCITAAGFVAIGSPPILGGGGAQS